MVDRTICSPCFGSYEQSADFFSVRRTSPPQAILIRGAVLKARATPLRAKRIHDLRHDLFHAERCIWAAKASSRSDTRR